MYNKGNNTMSYGDGMASNKNTPKKVMTPGQKRMDSYAKGGGLKGYMKGGDVMDVYQTGGNVRDAYSQVKYKKDGTLKKYGAISEKKFNRKSDRYSKQEGSKSLGTNTSKGQQVVAGRGDKSVSRRSK